MRVWLLGLAACGRIGFDPLGTGEPLALSPEQARVNPSSLVQLIASGGALPYAFAIGSGQGDVDEQGAFRCPVYPSTTTVEVRDLLGDVASSTITCDGDYLYSAGGVAGTTTAQVFRSRDSATWTLAGTLPIPRTGGALVAYDDQLFYLGGADVPDGIEGDEVYASRDGMTWALAGHLPEPREAVAATVFRGRIWIGGGIRNDAAAYTTNTWSSADGISWRPEVPLPREIHGAALVPFHDELWLVAGHEAAGQVAGVYAFDGVSWRAVGTVPAAGEYFGATVWNEELWVGGGIGLNNRVVKTSDGSTWTELATIGMSRSSPALFSHGGEMWIAGGSPSQPLHSPDGNAWSLAGAFPVAALLYASYAQLTPP